WSLKKFPWLFPYLLWYHLCIQVWAKKMVTTTHWLISVLRWMHIAKAVFPACKITILICSRTFQLTKYMMYFGTSMDKMESSCTKCTEDTIEKILTRKK
ncbi:unnamed protein product, partial [Brassica oleracea var. botrytis]